jgi:hypothetical protein
MKKEPDHADSSLSETMAARIEIRELGDPAREKEITDAVEALDGVIENNEGCAARFLRSAGHEREENRGGCSFHRKCNQSRGYRQRDSASRPANSGECGSKNGNQNFLIF